MTKSLIVVFDLTRPHNSKGYLKTVNVEFYGNKLYPALDYQLHRPIYPIITHIL
jgi:hypothetical protein